MGVGYDLIYLLLRFCCRGGGHIMHLRFDSPDVEDE